LHPGEQGCSPQSVNWTNHDHGLYLHGNNNLVENNIFYDNDSGWHIQILGGDNYKIVNNTFINPSGGWPEGGTTGHILAFDMTNSLIANNISYNPVTSFIYHWVQNSSSELKNNLVYEGVTINNTSGWTLTDNIENTDPLFVNYASGDYHLQSDSPAINTGISTNAPATDYDSNVRPQGSTYDIGAYEYVSGVSTPPTCTSFTYSNWSPSTCPSSQTQTRTIASQSPQGCSGGTPTLTQSCTYIPPVTPPSTNTLTALKTLTPITTDGILELAWNQANSVTFSNSARSDNSVTVSALYDDTNLYFAYQVTDGNIEATGAKLWEDDGAEIYIDTQNNKSTSMDANDYSFQTNINNLTSNTSITAKTITTSTGYIQEITIPFTVLNITPNNQTLGLLLANNDRDNNSSSQFDHMNLINSGNYSRPNLWGSLTLSTQTTTQILQGDLNSDGAVNTLDWSIMNSAWGTSNTQADLNNDGVVNTIDFSILNGQWSG